MKHDEKAVKITTDFAIEYANKHWDVIGVEDFDVEETKDEFIELMRKDVDLAIWFITEVIQWCKHRDYYKKELSVLDEDSDESCEYEVLKLNGKHIKFMFGEGDDRYTTFVTLATKKTKVVTYWV